MLDNTPYMDSGHGDASNERKEIHTEATVVDDEHHLLVHGNMPKNEKEISSSSSTSSDDSSEEDFFQLDPIELNRALAESNDFFSVQHGGTISDLTFQNGETTSINQSNHGAPNLIGNESMFTGSQLPMGRPFSPGNSPGSKHYPPRNDVPDPNRIPSSIFERSKSSTPMEWSVASNESLFSIHVGNSSFSRDHVILLGKSGELGSMPPISPLRGRSGELGSTPPISPLGNSSEPTNTPPISPLSSPNAVNMDLGHMDMEQGLAQPGAAAATNAEAMKDVLSAASEEHDDEDERPAETPYLSNSISHRSDGSTTSFRSFAFPILTGEGRSGSVKVEPEPQRMKSEPLQQQQPPPPPSETLKPAPAPAGNKWFPCFSCCSLCC